MMKTTNTNKHISSRPRATRTPIRVHLAIGIPSPQDVVFAYLADLENNSEWNWSVAATTPIGGPGGEGRHFAQRRVSPRSANDLLEITALDPPRLVEILGDLDDAEVRYRYELTALTSDRTRLLTTVELTPKAPMPGARLYAGRLNDAISTNLESLKAVFVDRQLSVAVPAPR